MKKIIRSLLIVTLAAVFVSCGVFFASKEERWNPYDPNNELLNFNPSIDGYVEGTVWYGDLLTLYALPGSKLILIRFSTGDFPDSVASSYLKLKINTRPPNDADLAIHRIIQSWDAATISYSLANDPVAFFDDSSVATVKIPASVAVGEEVLIPLTGIYSGDKEKLGNGLIVSSSVTLQFESSESGMGPLLLIEPD